MPRPTKESDYTLEEIEKEIREWDLALTHHYMAYKEAEQAGDWDTFQFYFKLYKSAHEQLDRWNRLAIEKRGQSR